MRFRSRRSFTSSFPWSRASTVICRSRRCFRDEDLRADRQPEFTQIDLEMSFVDMEDVLKIGEGFMQRVFKEALGIELPLPLPRLTYREAMERYGSDKPDTRYGMEIYDLSDLVRESGFSVFSNAVAGGGSVRGITAKNAVSTLTRKEIDKLTEMIKGIGGKGLAWVRLTPDGITCLVFKIYAGKRKCRRFCNAPDAEDRRCRCLLLQMTKTSARTCRTLGAAAAGCWPIKLDVETRNGICNLLWIAEFPVL